MKIKIFASLLVVVFSLGGAKPSMAGEADAGRLIGGIIGGLIGTEIGDGNAAGTIVGVVVGALVGGEIAKDLSDSDRRIIVDKHNYAYDGRLNEPYYWRTDRTHGHVEIISETTYRSRRCRRYRNETTIYGNNRGRSGRTEVSTGWVCDYGNRGWVKTDRVIVDGEYSDGEDYLYLRRNATRRIQRNLRDQSLDSDRMEIIEEMIEVLDYRGKAIAGQVLGQLLSTWNFDTGMNGRLKALRMLAPYTVVRGGSVGVVIRNSNFEWKSSKEKARRILRRKMLPN